MQQFFVFLFFHFSIVAGSDGVLHLTDLIEFEFGFDGSDVIHVADVLFVVVEDFIVLRDFFEDFLYIFVFLFAPFLKFGRLAVFLEESEVIMDYLESFVYVHVFILGKYFVF